MLQRETQFCLGKDETVNSFENWKQNIVYSAFLVDGVTWGKNTKSDPLRGFIDNDADVSVNSRSTAAQKVTICEFMLGQIANYCPVLSRNIIVRNSTAVKTA